MKPRPKRQEGTNDRKIKEKNSLERNKKSEVPKEEIRMAC